MAGSWQGPRVAVVGCGRWGRNHVRNHAAIGSLAAVVDGDASAAAEAAEIGGVPALSFDAVLRHPSIKAVVFALPPSRNLPLGRAVLGAGKHLFVEKPLALSTGDGAALCRAADEAGRQLAVGHILRYHPAFRALEETVRAGRLGRVLSIAATRFDLGRVRREEDALWALSPHDVSMILALTGTEPERVDAFAGYGTHPTIADASHLDLAFPDGVRAEVRASWLHPLKEQRLVVAGEGALAVFDDREPWSAKLTLHPYRLTETGGDPRLDRGEPEPVAVEPAEPLRAECLAFLRAVETGRPAEADGREGLRVLAVLERAKAALEARRAGAAGARHAAAAGGG